MSLDWSGTPQIPTVPIHLWIRNLAPQKITKLTQVEQDVVTYNVAIAVRESNLIMQKSSIHQQW